MKNFWRILSMVIAVCVFGITANFAAANPDSTWRRGMGPDMMGGYGSGYGMGPGVMGYGNFRGLGPNDEQKSKIAQIRKTMRMKHMTLMNEMMVAQEELQELYDADKQDATAINKQYKVVIPTG